MNSLATTTKLHTINLQKPITVPLTDRLSVRLYADSRPHCMETAPLHKGLVLMLDNQEIIEEGMGFGVPVAKYQDKTYFSSSADVSIQKNNSIYLLTENICFRCCFTEKILALNLHKRRHLLTCAEDIRKIIFKTQKCFTGFQ